VPLSLVGTLPVSALNLGLAAAPAGIGVEVSKLQADITRLTGALDTQLAVTAEFPPNLAGYTAAFALALDPTAVAAAFDLTNWVTLNADAKVGLAIDLALLESLLAILDGIIDSFTLGLSAGGLAAWSYAGRAVGFGTTLDGATRLGIAGIPADQDVSAIIIGTASHASWSTFGEGFHVGTSAGTDLGDETSQELLAFLGTLTGRDLSTGVRDLFSLLDLLRAELEGRKDAIEAQIELSLGVNLPDPTAIVEAGLDIDLGAALGNLVDVQADLGADIDLLTLNVEAALALSASISAQLSVGGLTLWSYSGPMSELGAAFAPEIEDGVPGATGANGATYGLVIASASPTAWADFTQIFRTS
jgi:hypothetical protein